MAMNCGKDNLAEETTGKNTDWPKWDKFSISFNAARYDCNFR